MSALGSFQLSTQERRVVVVTGTILFALLNLWLVWPRFKDWNKVRTAIATAEKTLDTYRAEFARTNDYQIRLQSLETAGSTVLPSDQSVHLVGTVQAQASRSKLNHTGIRALGRALSTTQTNRFFEEQTVEVGINPTDDKHLIDFLVAIGSGESMIRVKDLQLKPDPAQMKLQGKIQLVASFQKAAPEPGGTNAPSAAGAPATNAPRSFSRAGADATRTTTNVSRANPLANKP